MYVNIRIKGKNPQNQKTLRTANQYHINQEINFLYTKKAKLNEQLYKLHLKCAEEWQGTWPIITQSIDYKLTNEMENQYDKLNRKLDKLQKEKKTREKNRQPAPTYTILHQDGQPHKHKILPRRNSATQ
jgi:hypothetical protein